MSHQIVHEHAKTCLKHVLSLLSRDDRLYVQFDADQLRRLRDDGRTAIDPLIGDFIDAATTIQLPGGGEGVIYCGETAKCAHGMAFQIADAVLRSNCDVSFLDEDALRALYAAIGIEFHRVTKSAWSQADSPTQWAKVFGCHRDTFIARCKRGEIRHQKLSDRSYKVHVDDLPALSPKKSE